MRRAAMAFLIAGFMVGEMVSGLGWQPAAEAAILAATANSVKAKPAKKTVTFGGYSVSVPANWPVYDLTKNPRQCVRYDVHAVYLGSPRPDQDQDGPPDLVGRADTISIGSVPKAPEVPKTPEVPGALPVPQASPAERGPAGRYRALDRRRHGGRAGGAQVGGRSPSRAGRIQFAMTGAGS